MDGRKIKTKQHREKLSEANKGNKPWNTGINGKEYNSHLKKGSVWNKGITGYKIHSEKHKEELKKLMIGNKLREGKEPWNKELKGYKLKPKTEEVRKRISNTLKNNPYYKSEKWKQTKKKISEKRKETLRSNPEELKRMNERRSKLKIPKQDSSIEIKIQNFLKELGIEYFTHQYMKIEHGYLCDILIPSMNLVVECDGDYWHKYPVGLDRDHIRTKELIDNGFKVLRLWECEIRKMDIKNFKLKLKGVKNFGF